MQRNVPLWGVVVTLVVFIVGLIGAVALLDLQYEVAVLGGTIAGSMASLFVAKQLETRAKIEQDIREKKVPVYDKLITTLFGVMLLGRSKASNSKQEDVTSAMAEFAQGLIFWGSNEVIKTYGAIRKNALSGSASTPDANALLEGLLLGIRKDLGHDNRGLENGALLRIFVNDVDRYLDADGNWITPVELQNTALAEPTAEKLENIELSKTSTNVNSHLEQTSVHSFRMKKPKPHRRG